MKRIIRHLLANNNESTFADFEDHCNLSHNEVTTLLLPHKDIFVLSQEKVSYNPPYGIRNKTSLFKAINEAFPKGIPQRCLNFCYEFAHYDINELQMSDKIFSLKFGKTDDLIFFTPNKRPQQQNLIDLWDLVGEDAKSKRKSKSKKMNSREAGVSVTNSVKKPKNRLTSF